MRIHVLRLLAVVLGLFLHDTTARGQIAWEENWEAQQEQLDRYGMAYQAGYTGSFFSHLHGGLRQGTNWQGLLDLAVLMDLEHLIGLNDTALHAEVLWLQGKRASSVHYLGNINEASNTQGLDPTVRPFHVWLNHRFLDGKLNFTAGWMTLDTDFMVSRSAALFVNAAFGPIQTWNANFAAPVYPLAALGFLTQWQINERQELQFGIYDGNTGGESANQGSANTRLGADDGAALLLEWTRHHELHHRKGSVKLGTGWDTGHITDFDTGRTRHGNGHVYTVLDQTLVPGATADGDDRLAFFTRLGHVFQAARSVVDFTMEAGLVGSGFHAGDQWGLAFSRSHISDSYAESIRADGGISSDAETVIELTYWLQVKPWLAFQPTLQYHHHPQSGAPSAFVAGLVMALTF